MSPTKIPPVNSQNTSEKSRGDSSLEAEKITQKTGDAVSEAISILQNEITSGRMSIEDLRKAMSSGEIHLEEITLPEYGREAEKTDPKFEDSILPIKIFSFQTLLLKELESIDKNGENGQGILFEEKDIDGFIYAKYLEVGDFVELIFRFSNQEFCFRGIVENVSTNGFFVIFQMEISKTTVESNGNKKNEYFYGRSLLILPIRSLGEKRRAESKEEVRLRKKIQLAASPKELEKLIEQIEESTKKKSTTTSKTEIRRKLEKIESDNRDILMGKYDSMQNLLQTIASLGENNLTSIRYIIPATPERTERFNALLSGTKGRFSKLFFWNK